jgi:NAD(P)H-hydrate epimerase
MSDLPTYNGDLPWLTTDEMIEVDRAMIEDYHIQLIQMMENAGRNLAHLARIRFLDQNPRNKLVIILAGTGGNGGGVLVCARSLFNYGARVEVITTRPDQYFSSTAAHQLDILNRMGLKTYLAKELESQVFGTPELIIDGIIGYSLKGAPRDSASTLIRFANDQNIPILSLDVPSGIDTTTGTIYEPAVHATATLTLALPKNGLLAPGVADLVGELYLGDISVPRKLYSESPLEYEVPDLFTESDIIRLW